MKFKLWHKRNGKSKSIKNKLTLIISCFVVICCLLLGATTSFLNYKTSNNILSKAVVETTKQASETISQKIINLENAAIQTGIIKEISDPKVSKEEKQNIIARQENLYGLTLGHILDLKGIDSFSGKDYSDRDYFKIAMSGKPYMSSSIVSKTTGKTTMLVSAPIWENGVQGSKIVGVVTFNVNKDFLNDIVSNIQIGENSYPYLLDKEGTTIAAKDDRLIGGQNTIKKAEEDKSLIPFAEADKKVISGETGYFNLKYNGQIKVLGYAPIKYSDGWGIGITTNKDDFLGDMYISIIITIILAIVFTIVAFIVAIKLSNKIGNPLKECSERLKMLAEGDLKSETTIVDEDNEIGLVADATSKIVDDFRKMINALTYILTEISNGNLDVNVDNDELNDLFVNDFEPILVAVNKILDSLNSTLIQINVAGEQVAIGSNQLSEGAQVLSQGATEQASSTQELSATINEVSLHVKQNAENAVRAREISMKSSIAIDRGKEQMQEMIAAMDEISNTSNRIGDIIKNIDSIAFQTNILALNAAVEASRAGEAGKGFAVVADEVRNLASKSAQSAKDTSDLIEKILIAIENGTIIVSETAKSLEEVVYRSQESSKIIQEIADASNEQAQNIDNVNIGVEQISTVVQANSATAEESAASSEELSSQAQMLKELIDQFKLKNEKEKLFNIKEL
ncbi:methyl-accepting chemotaxis protein [Paraclostridium sordellii]|uniref:methyl-accepting chemotaxis protein n=1 Tax=Paraclostridium sordellii TaxID=1505 RepID=UPI0005E20861|nr:methyl-accepting chemotaxis protein [Paeniclostridium sordellii]QYE98317.1 methyl-accepting chemotaxis protein [Paeniclostridium sordellii]CEO13399.1 methyl-accepting chemotaxis sensory transducer [[Clostridium] sordellii] [Paeniclostridium sordellii]CEP89031.1 methyl-accepting chemotaxis sensory transducer [[Clostridium] sordellii] [Paeniclostridium sordellii]CEP97897.1 methyl-accepting chemotaxis sensory transducer [[Clostridium] sordellii] [Paeniclostridium sordellii]CEQ01285.1 methyl-ac